MGSMDEETVTALDDIRKELRIANQLKFLELARKAWNQGELFGLTDIRSIHKLEQSVYLNLRDKLVLAADI